MFSKEDIRTAGEISRFMMDLYKVDADRYNKATENCIPFGDIAYAQALIHWRKNGCKKESFFSWHESQQECPLTIAFRKEISEKFGLEILSQEEAKERVKVSQNLKTKKVKDWGLN